MNMLKLTIEIKVHNLTQREGMKIATVSFFYRVEVFEVSRSVKVCSASENFSCSSIKGDAAILKYT